MKSREIIHVGLTTLFLLSLNSCAPSAAGETPTPPRLTATEPVQLPLSDHPSTPIPGPTSTPTAFRSGIHTLSPMDRTAIASQMAPTSSATPDSSTRTPVNTPAEPLIPRHNLHIAFVDRLHGWVSGITEPDDGSVDAIAATSDGGKTWQALQIPPVDQNFQRVKYVLEDSSRVKLLFTDAKNGWLYQNLLYQTRDGGQTWEQAHPRGVITQMGQATDGTFWALEKVVGSWMLWKVAGDAYSEWIDPGFQLPGESTRLAMDRVFLSVIDFQNAWMVYWINFLSGEADAGSHLYRTSDGGKNWESVPAPKPCDLLPLVISPVDPRELWMGCGYFGSAGSGISAAFKSTDGGHSWSEKRYTTLGYFRDVEALSKTFVYMTYERLGGLTISYDGGETWQEVYFPCEFYSPQAFFIDESVGWAACDSSVNRTTDGGRTWECINITDDKVCR